ncbi:hypothetical protein [Bacillus pseudomycoides]|uniref:hypothetical protein n=1 Tax=Bacillus pseudomycoides TaxID=64104 RepID=UPI0015CF23A7|nr:hypothetical protein [Bacillus pseudomycoides]MED4653247.1 hypothetical protein [Bacillus pseudomycoides]
MMKVARTVLTGGKGSDNFKLLSIRMNKKIILKIGYREEKYPNGYFMKLDRQHRYT